MDPNPNPPASLSPSSSLKRRAPTPSPQLQPLTSRRRLTPLDLTDSTHRALDQLVLQKLEQYRASTSFDPLKTLVALVKTCQELDPVLADLDAASRLLDEREEVEMLLMVGWEGREFKHVRNHPALRRKQEQPYPELPAQARWDETSVDSSTPMPLPLPPPMPLPMGMSMPPRSPEEGRPRPMQDGYGGSPQQAHVHHHQHPHHQQHQPPHPHQQMQPQLPRAEIEMRGEQQPQGQMDAREAQYYGPRLESEEPGPSRPKWNVLAEHPSYHEEIDELEDDEHLPSSSYPSYLPSAAAPAGAPPAPGVPGAPYANPNRRRSYVPTSARAAQLEERASRSTGIVKLHDARCKRCIARGIQECTIYKSTRTPNNGRVACHMCQKMKVKCEWERNPNDGVVGGAAPGGATGVAVGAGGGTGEGRELGIGLGGGAEGVIGIPPREREQPLGEREQGAQAYEKPNRIWERDYEPLAPSHPHSQHHPQPPQRSTLPSMPTMSLPSLPQLPLPDERDRPYTGELVGGPGSASAASGILSGPSTGSASASASASAASFSTEGTPSLTMEGSEDVKPLAQPESVGAESGRVDGKEQGFAGAGAGAGVGGAGLAGTGGSPGSGSGKRERRRAPKVGITQVIRRVAVIKTGAARCDYCQKKKWDKCTISTTAMKACQACHRMKQRCQWSLSVGVGADKGGTEEVKMELEEPVYASYQPEESLDSPDSTDQEQERRSAPGSGEYPPALDGYDEPPPQQRYVSQETYEPRTGYAPHPQEYAPTNGYSHAPPPGLGLSGPDGYGHSHPHSQPHPHMHPHTLSRSLAPNQSYERTDTNTYTPLSRGLQLNESYERGRERSPPSLGSHGYTPSHSQPHSRIPSNESYERAEPTPYQQAREREREREREYERRRSASAGYSDGAGISRPASSRAQPQPQLQPQFQPQYQPQLQPQVMDYPKGMDQLLEPRPVSRQESSVSSVTTASGASGASGISGSMVDNGAGVSASDQTTPVSSKEGFEAPGRVEDGVGGGMERKDDAAAPRAVWTGAD